MFSESWVTRYFQIALKQSIFKAPKISPQICILRPKGTAPPPLEIIEKKKKGHQSKF